MSEVGSAPGRRNERAARAWLVCRSRDANLGKAQHLRDRFWRRLFVTRVDEVLAVRS
jgi:hypothetical protein